MKRRPTARGPAGRHGTYATNEQCRPLEVAPPPGILSVDVAGAGCSQKELAFDRLWRDHAAPLSGHLQPGLTSQEMDELAEPLGISLPAEARAWWGRVRA